MKTSSVLLLFCVVSTGRVAALSMMGKATEIQTVPYFWSAMFGKSLRYAGKRTVAFPPHRLTGLGGGGGGLAIPS